MLRRLLLGILERIDSWFDVDLGDLDDLLSDAAARQFGTPIVLPDGTLRLMSDEDFLHYLAVDDSELGYE